MREAIMGIMIVQNLPVKCGQILLDMRKGLKDMLIVNGITTIIVRDTNLVAIVIADANNEVLLILIIITFSLIPNAYCRGHHRSFLHIIILLTAILIFIINGCHSL